jgi:RNA polymerase-interacting CarD/CdnL/TRCF family regulator
MGEVKRYKCGYNPHVGAIMIEAHHSESDLYRKDSDYARLERERDMYKAAVEIGDLEASQAELTRLRAVEAAANAMLDASPEKMAAAERYLAEACGRKG